LWLGTAAIAATPNCLVHFASVPADAVDYSLVEKTYDRLFDALGTQISPATMEAMLQPGHESPLKVPEQKDADWLTLNRNLEGFEKLLETKGWKRPEVLARLSDRLRARIGAQAKSRTVRERAELRTVPDVSLPLGKQTSEPLLSPDGKWILVHDGTLGTDENRPWNVTVINTSTHEQKVYPTRGGVFRVEFTSDSSRLLLTYLNNRLDWIPFTNGVPDFSAPQSANLHAEWGASHFSVYPTGNPDIVFVADNHNKVGRFDLAAKTAKEVDLSAVLASNEGIFVGGYAILPGTDHLVLHIAMQPHGGRYSVVKVGQDGKAVEIKRHDGRIGDSDRNYALRWRADGEMEYFIRDEKIFFNGPRGPEVKFDAKTVGPEVKIQNRSVVSANGDAAIYLKDGNKASTLEGWALPTGQKLLDFPEPARDPFFSPDGKRAFSKYFAEGDKVELRIYNLEGRREGTP